MNLMNKIVAIVSLLGSTQATEVFEPNYNVSRTAKDVRFVYQIGAQGSHTPKEFLNLTKNHDDELQLQAGYVTPLGIRQQYMIGDELRYRYVEEQKRTGAQNNTFLSELYDITQIYIQTSWNDTSILSAQAMLLGIYPPGQNIYKIKDSQKYNAVPPVEGFDFKPWIDEMGDEALPYQTTVFPIQMNGWSYDYMLALDNQNCKARKDARAAVKPRVDANAQAVAQNTPAIKPFFEKYGWEKFCDYISWAYVESIELQSGIDIDSFYSACQLCQKNATMEYHQLDWTNSTTGGLNGLSTNDLRKHLKGQIGAWLNKIQSTTHQNYTGFSQADKAKGAKAAGTAGSENPSYVMLWTNEEMLSLIAQALSGDAALTTNDLLLPLGPSSTVVLGFTLQDVVSTDGTNTTPYSGLYVSAYVNDQAVSLRGCSSSYGTTQNANYSNSSYTSCTASAFFQSLTPGVDVGAVCGARAAHT